MKHARVSGQLHHHLSDRRRQGEDVALNVTGGTKPMAIAAQQVFQAEKLPIFYVHPAPNQVVPLFSGEPPFSIEERVGLTDYLGIHGFREPGRAMYGHSERHAMLADLSQTRTRPLVFSRALMKKGLRPHRSEQSIPRPRFFARPDEEGIAT